MHRALAQPNVTFSLLFNVVFCFFFGEAKNLL